MTIPAAPAKPAKSMGSLVKIKTADAPRLAIDWLVAMAEGLRVVYHDDGITRCIMKLQKGCARLYAGRFTPSFDWSQGGPIIEREEIYVWCPHANDGKWASKKDSFTDRQVTYGPTALIAAMRCYSFKVYGEEAEVPEELLG